MTGIYFIQSILKPERIYVGSAVDIVKRFGDHKRDLTNSKHHNILLQRHFDSYGISDLEFISIVAVNAKEHLIEVEQDFIDVFEPYFNICRTAGSCLGRKHSEETKLKLSEGRKDRPGIKHSEETKQKLSEINSGKTLSEEHKRKLSKAATGRVMSEEVRRKISEAFKGEKHPQYGKTRSEETKRKLSEAHKGEKHYNYDHTIYHFYHVTYGELFCTKFDLQVNFNLRQSGVSMITKGVRKMHQGWCVIK